MNTRDLKDIVMTGALVGAAWLLYKGIRGVGSAANAAGAAVGQAASATSSSIADIADWLFPHATGSFATGSTIVLSTGAEIPANAAGSVGQFTDVDNVQKIQFTFAGHTWRTTGPPDDTNTYYAILQS